MLKYFIFVFAALSVSCSNQNKTSEELNPDDPCMGALQDESIVQLLETNKNRIAPGYTGVLAGKYPIDTTCTQFLLYFSNGNLFSYESFYLNGNLKFIKPIHCNSANGLLDYYYEDGSINFTLEMYMGRKHGEGVSYYPSGKERQIRYFTDDTLDGYQYEFFENGDTSLVEKFAMGNRITQP